jgi:hypothetical protein
MADLILQIKPNAKMDPLDFRLGDLEVSLGDQNMRFEDLLALRFGFWEKPKVGTAYYFIFKDRQAREMLVGFDIQAYSKEEAEGLYGQIVAQLMQVYGTALIAKFHDTLRAGGEVKLATCKATREGVHFKTPRWFGTRDHFVAWDQLGFADSDQPCHIWLGDLKDKVARLNLNLGGEWHGHYFLQYIQLLRKSPKMLTELKG